ncbi:uncharacterized protein APUU_80858S [Aspergillus puulaauensis]|uniref:Uncharacterized protein n=1 Tax=Aspergillus puulaauensis TaxID=1220207 RepID=A0A7R7XZF8_9EURO|nr:uncharacterized protein APUU_80858S [Aspergillus puulaauensis]BCS30555.1 hypothetical protein APUU_80858S [Aspergillus puulaauensis]
MSSESIEIHPILLHPPIYQLTLTTRDQANLAASLLTPPLEMPLYRGWLPDPIRKRYIRDLENWREKRYFEEIDFILRCWDDPTAGTFLDDIDADDIYRIKGEGMLAYRDGYQLRILSGSGRNKMFTGLRYEEWDEKQEGQSQATGKEGNEASIQDNQQDEPTKSYEERHLEAVEHITGSVEAGLGDSWSIVNDTGKTSRPPSAGLPPGISSVEARMFARDRYSMWARPLPNDAPNMDPSQGLPDALRCIYDHRRIDWKKPEFSGLIPEYINERGRREVERGYIWGIPYHAFETTRRRVGIFPEDKIYLDSGLEFLLRVEHWYLSQSDEEVRQLDPNDILTWKLPLMYMPLLQSFIGTVL